ncbi:MAG: modC [Rhizorhabdus sp.]|nr:modC [Rhizorhabdus sp.]
MSFDINVRRRIGERTFHFDFQTGPGLTAVFGTSGSGKTSLMYMVAGVVRPDSGRIAVAGRTLYDGAGDFSLAIEERHGGFVFQDGRLFPHLSVRANLLYGAKLARGRPPLMDLDETVAFLGIADLLHRRPASLSGGEAQRVAIGRALLGAPAFILMDEPLTGLDSARKREIIGVIQRLRDEVKVPILFVSHDLHEVERLADHLVLIEDDRIRSAGPVNAVLTDLAHPIAHADDALMILPVTPDSYDPAYDITLCHLGAVALHMPGRWTDAAGPLRLRIRAVDVSLSVGAPARTSVLNSLPAQIVGVEENGRNRMSVALLLDGGGPEARILSSITRKSWDMLGLHPGDPVTANIKAVALLDRQGRA